MPGFFKSCRSRYHVTVRRMASVKSQVGYQPSSAPAFSMDNESNAASCGAFGSELSVHLPGHDCKISSTSRLTGWRAEGSGPKLNGLTSFEFFDSWLMRSASQR